MSKWQPIATAPKDGTAVDLWWHGQRMPDCTLVDARHGWTWFQNNTGAPGYGVNLGPGDHTGPTHWIEAPLPPEDAA